MRKYQYKESKNFARILDMIHVLQIKQKRVSRVFKHPMMLLKDKAEIYWWMLKLRWKLEQGKRLDFYSENDYLKLKDMWWSILNRTYEPK